MLREGEKKTSSFREAADIAVKIAENLDDGDLLAMVRQRYRRCLHSLGLHAYGLHALFLWPT